jgi:predicted enzyme related to lactoylglutathione lyase
MADVVLNLVVLRSADLDRAARFYTVLGIDFAREQHGSGPEHLACSLGEVVLEIYLKADGSDDSQTGIGFLVPSVGAIVEEVRLAGGTIVSPPRESEWGLRAVVADPDGHRVELTERKS